jgi:hypothetical protein
MPKFTIYRQAETESYLTINTTTLSISAYPLFLMASSL